MRRWQGAMNSGIQGGVKETGEQGRQASVASRSAALSCIRGAQGFLSTQIC